MEFLVSFSRSPNKQERVTESIWANFIFMFLKYFDLSFLVLIIFWLSIIGICLHDRQGTRTRIRWRIPRLASPVHNVHSLFALFL